ncbi:MAG: uracil-DNA glycosylase [Dehalococcoidia bacterium]|nr:uracil-DNA glycosylase [Dehalococcoidia bacterium]
MSTAAAERLYERVRACDLCPLWKTRTNAVPGEGPIDAEVMFIGEAPGVNEDRQGRPFVGAAGQFLDELFAAAGLSRQGVYICNVLKCRPPANRDPMPGEIDACRDYLDEQIDIVDPLVIVTLGRFSMAKFFPNQTISRIHGQAREAAGRFYVPMYHPAAALHQGSLRQVILNDFAKLPALLERARKAEVRPAPPLPMALSEPPDSQPSPRSDSRPTDSPIADAPIEAAPPSHAEATEQPEPFAPETAAAGRPTQIRLFD